MIYCPSCGTANRDGSRFCNECGTKLPTVTSALCPVCGTPNPPNSLFCEKCGTRLVAALPDEPEEEAPVPSAHIPKGLSLPTRPASSEETPKSIAPAQPESEEAPDWMDVLRSASAGTSEADLAAVTPPGVEAASNVPEPPTEVPDWLSGLGIVDQSSAELKEPDAGEVLPEWAERLRSMPDAIQMPADEEVPDWLKDLGAVPRSSDAGVDSERSAPAVPPSPEEKVPDWLKPLSTQSETPAPRPEQGFAPSDEISEAPQEELPDWLRDLRPAAATADALPDWLDELGAGETEQAAPEETAASTGDSALDWVTQLSAAAAIGAAADKESAAPDEKSITSAEVPDWLQEASAAVPGEQSSEALQPDWLSTVRAATPELDTQPSLEESMLEEHSETAEPAAPGGNLPFEVAGSGLSEVAPAEPSAESEMPDWLNALRAATPEPEVTEATTPEASASLASSEQESAEEAPDWLRDLGPVAPAADVEAAAREPVPESTEEEGIPDWLKGLGAAAAGAAVVGAAADHAGVGEQPAAPPPEQKIATDWLSQLRQATPEIEEQHAEEEEPEWFAEAPAAAAGMTEQAPDWFPEPTVRESAQIPSAAAEEQPPAPAGEPAEEEAGLPAWLKDLGIAAAGAGVVAAAAQPSDEAREAEEVPEWVREAGEAMPLPAAAEMPEWLREEKPSAEAPQPEEFPEWLRESGAETQPPGQEPETGEMPDWLRDLMPAAAVGATAAAVQAEPEEQEQQPGVTAAEPAEEQPGWLAKMAPVAAAGIGLAAVQAARSEQPEAPEGEMPEWLKDLSKEKGAIPVPAEQPTEEQPTLSQAELPAWLEAMRPAEGAFAPEVSEAELEKEGPLAAIAGVLSPTALMGEVQGEPSKLRFDVSAEDLARAGVLQELLTRAQPAPVPTELPVVKGAAIRRRALRWIMLAAILFAVLLPAGLDLNAQLGVNLLPRLDKLPAAAVPPSTQQAASQIASLPQNATVLVIFDYDATQAGELNRVADVLFRHLLTRGARIEAASLNPQGSRIAQTVWDTLPAEQKSAGQFEPQAYVPGQAAGVQSLLAAMGKADLVIELAASPDSVRWWAEQLTVTGNSTPFVAGVSAAAETLTLPYIQSGQVKGLITGAAGALLYARAAGLPTTFANQIEIESMVLANWTMGLIIVISLVLALAARARRRPV